MAVQKSERNVPPRMSAALGVSGAALLLTSAGYLTHHLTHDEPAGHPLQPVARVVQDAPPPVDAEVRQTVERIKAESDQKSVRIQRPPSGSVHSAVDESEVTTAVKRHGDETVRVITARQDLTGYRELGSVVGGRPFRKADCTQTFRFSQDGAAKRLPRLLVCWRTSETRSVFTVSVDPEGSPSRAFSVTALESAWSRLD